MSLILVQMSFDVHSRAQHRSVPSGFGVGIFYRFMGWHCNFASKCLNCILNPVWHDPCQLCVVSFARKGCEMDQRTRTLGKTGGLALTLASAVAFTGIGGVAKADRIGIANQ